MYRWCCWRKANPPTRGFSIDDVVVVFAIAVVVLAAPIFIVLILLFRRIMFALTAHLTLQLLFRNIFADAVVATDGAVVVTKL